jgi:hypothetical protein
MANASKFWADGGGVVWQKFGLHLSDTLDRTLPFFLLEYVSLATFQEIGREWRKLKGV